MDCGSSQLPKPPHDPQSPNPVSAVIPEPPVREGDVDRVRGGEQGEAICERSWDDVRARMVQLISRRVAPKLRLRRNPLMGNSSSKSPPSC